MGLPDWMVRAGARTGEGGAGAIQINTCDWLFLERRLVADIAGQTLIWQGIEGENRFLLKWALNCIDG